MQLDVVVDIFCFVVLCFEVFVSKEKDGQVEFFVQEVSLFYFGMVEVVYYSDEVKLLLQVWYDFIEQVVLVFVLWSDSRDFQVIECLYIFFGFCDYQEFVFWWQLSIVFDNISIFV